MVVFGAVSPEVLRIASSGDSSPSSAEPSFRQIDDVFLQTQTRIWFGEVLKTRLNEQLSIADLLADGELLFEVSRVIWKMMRTKRVELKCGKSHDYVPFTSRNSGRYMPYSNIDSFLEMCKNLGLAGIDLFSPSDVVEKKDTRKVCMCIRALSKKARSRHFNVPDFDIVTYTVAMPTDMVGYIRKSWELSHCGYSSSSHSPEQKLRQRSRQKQSNGISGSCDSYFDEFDDMESKFVLQSDGSATICLLYQCSQMRSDLKNSPEVSSRVKNDFFDKSSVQFDVKNQQGDECIQCQEETVHLSKLTRSLFSGHLDHGHQDNTSSPAFGSKNRDESIIMDQIYSDPYLEDEESVVMDSCECSISRNNIINDFNIQLGGRALKAKTGARNRDESIIMDQIYSDPYLEDAESVVVDSCECSISRNNVISDHRAISTPIRDEAYTGGPILHDGEDCNSDACVHAASCCSKATRTPENEFSSRCLDGDISEVSSVASVSPVSSTASVSSVFVDFQNMDFDAHLDPEDAFKNVRFPESENSKCGGLSKRQTGASKYQNMVEYETTEMILSINNEESLSEGEGMDIHTSSLRLLLTNSDKCTPENLAAASSCDNSICKSQINSDVGDDEKELFAGQSCSPLEYPKWDQKGKEQIAVLPTVDDGCGTSPLSLSLLQSPGQDIELIQSEVTRDTLLHEETESVIADNDEDKVQTENLQKSAVEDSDGTESPSTEIAKSKPHKRPSFKSVLKGIAVVGVLVLLLHFRKNGRDISGWSRKQTNGTRNVNAGHVLSAKERKRHGTKGVYPAEKLKL